MALTVPASYLSDLVVGSIASVRSATMAGVVLDTAGFVIMSLAPAGVGARLLPANGGGSVDAADRRRNGMKVQDAAEAQLLERTCNEHTIAHARAGARRIGPAD